MSSAKRPAAAMAGSSDGARFELGADKAARADAAPAVADTDRRLLAKFVDEQGEPVGPPMELPHDVTPKQLNLLCNKLLQHDEDEQLPYSFFINDKEVTRELSEEVEALGIKTEEMLSIVFQPQAVFKVRAITKCSATIPGHTDNIVELYFSPDGRHLASGSGDCTVRFWDIWTQTPKLTCKGHQHWVQCIAWSPDGLTLASGSRDCHIRIWDPETGKEIAPAIKAHRQFINAICWQPLHLSKKERCTLFASASKDASVKIWDYSRVGAKLVLSFAGHSKSVTCLRWGGDNLIYTGSQDTTIKVWRADDGALCRTLQGHAHWVNSLALNTDYVLRTGAFDEHGRKAAGDAREIALARYNKVKGDGPERLASASEDHTVYVWTPATSKKPLVPRLTGHQKGVNHVLFSPDGRILATAGFDKAVKLWDGRTGRFLMNLRGHVGPVFRMAWAGDSRMLISASEDSTMKLWDVKTGKMVEELPGHAGSVYAVDWSPTGTLVASGGADKTLKLWRN